MLQPSQWLETIVDAAAYRKLADDCGERAQQAQGFERSQLLNEADQWDQLAESADEAAVTEQAEKSDPAVKAVRETLHLPEKSKA